MLIFPKIEDLVLKYSQWRFQDRLSGWGWLLEVHPFHFAAALHLGFIFLYHMIILNKDAYCSTFIQGTYSTTFK